MRGLLYSKIHSLMLGRSPIKWRQRPVMIMSIDWGVKHQIKQVSSKSQQLFLWIILRNHFVDKAITMDYVTLIAAQGDNTRYGLFG